MSWRLDDWRVDSGFRDCGEWRRIVDSTIVNRQSCTRGEDVGFLGTTSLAEAQAKRPIESPDWRETSIEIVGVESASATIPSAEPIVSALLFKDGTLQMLGVTRYVLAPGAEYIGDAQREVALLA